MAMDGDGGGMNGGFCWWVERTPAKEMIFQNVGDGPLFMLVSHRLLILTNHPSSRRGQLKRRHFTPRTA
jgi:hypothetical protein